MHKNINWYSRQNVKKSFSPKHAELWLTYDNTAINQDNIKN